MTDKPSKFQSTSDLLSGPVPACPTKRQILSSGRYVTTLEYPDYVFKSIKRIVHGIFYIVVARDRVLGPYCLCDIRFSGPKSCLTRKSKSIEDTALDSNEDGNFS